MKIALILLGLCSLCSCATPLPTIRPCGVITDNLLGVTATDVSGERRLAIHYARGKAASCWK